MAPTKGNIQLRPTPEVLKALALLQRKTGLNQTSAIRLAIMEAADKRGVK